jgi:hypothetical protein
VLDQREVAEIDQQTDPETRGVEIILDLRAVLVREF